MGSGNTSYGYCYLDGQLVSDPKEQQVIRRIVEMRKNGMSYRSIAEFLNRQGTPTRHGKTWRHVVVKEIYEREREGAFSESRN